MGTPHGGVVSVHIIIYSVSITYIGVGLSALLGLDEQGNARASICGTGQRTGSTFFRVYAETNLKLYNICCGSRAERKSEELCQQMQNNGVRQHQGC